MFACRVSAANIARPGGVRWTIDAAIDVQSVERFASQAKSSSIAGLAANGLLLELVAPQAAVDWNDRAGDVSGEGGGKKAGEVCHILWLAIATDWDLVLSLPFAVFG
jgi:hypothetical protein